MKIRKISVYNIGSYEGLNTIDISNIKGNIVLFGGKNGAGKTTLFESIKICLYGYKEAGYQTISPAYRKRIKSLINDYAKLETNVEAYVSMEIELFNGQDNDIYELKRKWTLLKEIDEQFTVKKNDIELSQEELESFNSYVLDLIPPELFNLYFFDGEQIADSFLSENGSEKIKNAFLVLCGYDTFDIMLQNFKRISYNKKTVNTSSTVYLESKQKLAELKAKYNIVQENVKSTYATLENLTSELQALEATYRQNGGVTIQEWNQKLESIKNEENAREHLNSEIKELVNDKIPFLILKKQLLTLFDEIEVEENYAKKKDMYNQLETILPEISKKLMPKYSEKNSQAITGFYNDLKEQLLDKVKVEKINPILQLSYSEQQILTNSIIEMMHFDETQIIENREKLKKSLALTKELRESLDSCNIDDVQNFLQKKELIGNKKKELLDSLQDLLAQKSELEINVKEQETVFKHDTKVLEEELKNNSIVDISAKATLFLENLQNELLINQIHKVEELFIEKLNQLMRKSHFIDKIVIDPDFNIHIFKRIIIKCKTICAKINEMGLATYKEETGTQHCQDILDITGCKTMKEFFTKYKNSNEVFDVMHEFEKNHMSKGEKQIFIMSLYWALMTLSDKNVPFIIDTPFARIDKEHRSRITRHFFNELNGQVFIFSTDEEIVGQHLQILKPKIGKTFLLENNNNKKSSIIENEYF